MYINNDNKKKLTHAPNPNPNYRAKSLIMNACVRACLLIAQKIPKLKKKRKSPQHRK